MNSIAASKLSDEQVAVFFRRLGNELNSSSTGKTIAQVHKVLSRIKVRYSASEITEIINKTPALLHFVLIGSSRNEEDRKPILHLDELVDTLYMEDQQADKKTFSSEIEVLGTVLIILKRMQGLLKYAGMQLFPYTLSNELHHAAIEEAA